VSTLALPLMISSDLLCPIGYTLISSDGSTYDSALFTSYTESTNILTIYSTDNSKVETYSLKVIGKLLYGPATKSYTFSVVVKHQCSLTVITSAPVSSATYDISETNALSNGILTWSQTFPAICDAIAYTIIDTLTNV
jgi:hypothetical protein